LGYGAAREFCIVNPIRNIETIADSSGVRKIATLRQRFARASWRKKKGIATVQLPDGKDAQAQIHWYEAHGIGEAKLKIEE
jgi:hypothetical protein